MTDADVALELRGLAAEVRELRHLVERQQAERWPPADCRALAHLVETFGRDAFTSGDLLDHLAGPALSERQALRAALSAAVGGRPLTRERAGQLLKRLVRTRVEAAGYRLTTPCTDRGSRVWVAASAQGD